MRGLAQRGLKRLFEESWAILAGLAPLAKRDLRPKAMEAKNDRLIVRVKRRRDEEPADNICIVTNRYYPKETLCESSKCLINFPLQVCALEEGEDRRIHRQTRLG